MMMAVQSLLKHVHRNPLISSVIITGSSISSTKRLFLLVGSQNHHHHHHLQRGIVIGRRRRRGGGDVNVYCQLQFHQQIKAFSSLSSNIYTHGGSSHSSRDIKGGGGFLGLTDEQLMGQCEMSTFKASGPGGQHRNNRESAVRLKHRPTGILAQAVEDRSQHKNRASALGRLRALLALKASDNTRMVTQAGFSLISSYLWRYRSTAGFCVLSGRDTELLEFSCSPFVAEVVSHDSFQSNGLSDKFKKSVVISEDIVGINEPKVKGARKKSVIEFSKVDMGLLPTVILIGRPNVGKSALFNRFIRRREALVYNTPDDHVTRDIREGLAKLGDLRFKVLDSAGLETAATSGSILNRTTEMTGNVIARTQFALFLIDVRDGLQPLDMEVGKWLRKHAPGVSTILVMNKSESIDDHSGFLSAAVGEAYKLGFGDPIAISAETGLGMADLYDALRPLLENYMLSVSNDEVSQGDSPSEVEDAKLPLQLAIVGRPNVGKSTLLNALLQEDRVLVGPEAGLTRDSVRARFEFQGRTIYLVDTAGWLQKTNEDKGPGSLSVMQSRKNLMRAHVVALVLDAEEIAKARRSMKHAETVIARQAVEEGRGLVVIVNKMDLLRGKENSKIYEEVIKAVNQTVAQVTGVPVVFVSALEGKGCIAVMRQVMNTYEKWCLRLSTARLNRWLRKVMSRHSWKDQAAKPKIKFFTQVKARPPTFVAFLSGKAQLSDTDIRFLTKSLKEDFDLSGIPIRILQRSVQRKAGSGVKSSQSVRKLPERILSDKRNVSD